MVRLTKLVKIVVMSVTTTFVACQKAVNMKALVLSTIENETSEVTVNLDAYGIPYDVIEFTPTTTITGDLELYNENNEPKYSLIIVNGGGLYQEIKNNWVSALSNSQWKYLEEYEAKNSVRRVVISEEASDIDYATLYEEDQWGDTYDVQPLIIDNSEEVKSIFKDAGIKTTAKLDVNEVYHTRIKIVNSRIAKPLLYYADGDKKGPVGAAIIKYDNGREVMSFFFSLGSWSTTGVLLSHIWVTWGTRSLYSGFRRVYFTPQIDDIFLSTELVDVKNKQFYGSNDIYRSTPNDFEKLAQFQKDILKEMPEGSFFRSELAFNGNGVLNTETVVVDGERYCDIEYVMEPGSGDHRWPKEDYKLTSAHYSAMERDELFKYFKNNSTIQQEFFWSSHTFTHENLDNVSRSDVDNEIRLNIEMAEILGIKDKDYWSSASMVTPQISGLHNKDALETLRKYGIYSATGDISRNAITNLEKPYLPFITTLKSSNLEGFPIVPRTPTEIYYFCSTKEEDTFAYNEIYRDYLEEGEEYTFDDLLESESDRTVQLLIRLRHEAHQFHQANIRSYPKEGNYGESLLEDWTRSIVKRYNEYVEWPMVSLKMDDLATKYLDRYMLEYCKSQSKFIVEDDEVVGISVTASNGSCNVPITLPKGVSPVSLPEGATSEQRGNDPVTVWVPVQRGEVKTFKIKPVLKWKVDGSIVVESSTIITLPDEDEPETIAPTTTTKQNAITTTTVAITTTAAEQVPTTTTTTTTTTAVETETPQYKCKAEIYSYPCCPANVKKVYYTDDIGDWGYDFKNKTWCGLTPVGVETCWSEKYGYSCCKGCTSYYTDEYGDWGYENSNWCGIIPAVCSKN